MLFVIPVSSTLNFGIYLYICMLLSILAVLFLCMRVMISFLQIYVQRYMFYIMHMKSAETTHPPHRDALTISVWGSCSPPQGSDPIQGDPNGNEVVPGGLGGRGPS